MKKVLILSIVCLASAPLFAQNDAKITADKKAKDEAIMKANEVPASASLHAATTAQKVATPAQKATPATKADAKKVKEQPTTVNKPTDAATVDLSQPVAPVKKEKE